LDWVLAKDNIDKSNLYLYGQSIGGAIAISLASRNPKTFKGLILENTFTQMSDVIPHVIPALKYLTFLCHQKWTSIDDLKTLITENDDIKLLFMSGLKV
jgi:abhydrolase domain-containing protein 13